MTKREKWLLFGFIILALLFLFSIPLKIARSQEAHVNPQVLFVLDHYDARGRAVLEAKEVRPAYTVVPLEGEHPAPMAPEQNLICRPYDEGTKLFIRCGGTRYAVVNVGLVPKKQKKQEDE